LRRYEDKDEEGKLERHFFGRKLDLNPLDLSLSLPLEEGENAKLLKKKIQSALQEGS
jgi:hypothetical protein